MPHDLADEELLTLLEWRLDRWIAIGFTVKQALRLIEAGADHHEAERLLTHSTKDDRRFYLNART